MDLMGFSLPIICSPKGTKKPRVGPPVSGASSFPLMMNRIDDGAYEMSPTFK